MDKPVGYQLDEDGFGDNKSNLQELADHLTEWHDIPIIWVEGADSICLLCKNVDKNAKICGGYTKSDRDRTVSPETIRRNADEEVKLAYDVEIVRSLGDILRLERKPVLRRI